MWQRNLLLQSLSPRSFRVDSLPLYVRFILIRDVNLREQTLQHNTQTNYIKNYEFDYPQSHSLFTITCVSGHITSHDFYENHRKWNSCEPFDLFDAPVDVRIAPDKKFIEQNLLTQAKRADMLMIWTDCDREGEHIGMEITKVCRKAKPGIQVKRARFSAIIAQYVIPTFSC